MMQRHLFHAQLCSDSKIVADRHYRYSRLESRGLILKAGVNQEIVKKKKKKEKKKNEKKKEKKKRKIERKKGKRKEKKKCEIEE